MRVLVWGELFWPTIGGAELFAAALMRALRPRGYAFTVVASNDYTGLPDEASYQDVPVYRFPFREVLRRERIDELPAVRRRIAALCRTHAPHLILLNGIGPNAFFYLQAAADRRVPLVVRVNQELPRDPARPAAGTLAQRILHRADWVIGVAAATLEHARAIEPAMTGRSSLIYNGVESAAMPADPPGGPAHVLCLGRLVEQKGFDRAIAAFPAVLRRWPHTRMTVAGDGPERAALAAQARALGVAEAIDFIGWVAPDAVAETIARATIVVLPSRIEGLPGVALQAAAGGRPVVATRTGGVPEIVHHGETGLLVDRDGQGLADAILALLDDPALARRLGRAAWRRAREVFDPQACFDAYDALFRRLAGPAD